VPVDHLAIVGDGLVGRSIRLAYLRARPDAAVVSVDKGDDLGRIRDAAFIVLAAPVDTIIDLLPAVAEHAGADAVVTDTGSTKRAILLTAQMAGLRHFVGGHPMAGGTSSGPLDARADLFDGARWFLVRGSVAPATVDRVAAFVQALGARPVAMDDDGWAHDSVMAAVSHLPQVVSTALLAVAGEAVGAAGLAQGGRGLLDTTRLAGSSPGMWHSVLATNADTLAPLLRRLAHELDAAADRLDDRASVDALFDRARRWINNQQS
jgi:prephenate dehydrogenase